MAKQDKFIKKTFIKNYNDVHQNSEKMGDMIKLEPIREAKESSFVATVPKRRKSLDPNSMKKTITYAKGGFNKSSSRLRAYPNAVK